ncbi:MAG: 2-oxoacid:acceptor oxidoreductase family protein [Candidatus Marinimicrobia bacterium]|nr:2-oxoacid:acceptor oxidoreductase family protein [Candidatus Neomarinimicrobiota bacterium]
MKETHNSRFQNQVDASAGSTFILQGNSAFALGVIHAGYHAATGYPGTPSTEVIDKSLAHVKDRIQVGWSVNEAVAVSTALGHAMAGHDALVTMKIPGVYQAADAITTSAFFSGDAGALVIYAPTDYVPSSTQHLVDPRYFFASTRLPVLEPRNHQEMYDIASTAADLSRKFHTPVVVLASGILAHSEALIRTRESRITEPRELPDNLHEWMLLPNIARANYNEATRKRIPEIRKWCTSSDLVTETYGTEDWGIIASGWSEIIVREALDIAEADPSILSLAMTNPVPEEAIRHFAQKIKGKLFVIEDGDRFLEERIRLLDIQVTGKEELSVITNWTPEDVLSFLSEHSIISHLPEKKDIGLEPLPRPPAICPGCPYKAFALAIAKLKRKRKLYASFGDIGCSTLLYFYDALDTVSCMGASDSMRQGFVLSRPEMAHQTISVIGDSTECHSGMDSTRNAVFRNVPGVKIILDNYSTAMTGGQPAPSSEVNLEGRPHNFSLRKAIEAEGGRTVVVDAFDLKAVEKELITSLALAEEGSYSTIILEGDCILGVDKQKLSRSIEFDYDSCRKCDLCNMCPGIETDNERKPHYTTLCTNCAANNPVCLQRCPFDAIVAIDEGLKSRPQLPEPEPVELPTIERDSLPDSLRVAIRGIGGQGNLFFGKILSEVALRTPYANSHIVKGDTQGMAQLGGPVLSTFGCGDVVSPILAPSSADVLVVMEISEILRPGFLGMLKPGGTIILNKFAVLPITAQEEEYPPEEEIIKALEGHKVVQIDATEVAIDSGDQTAETANMVMLGVLSITEPFNYIPDETWQTAILALSPNHRRAMNIVAYNNGRKQGENLIPT